MISCGCNPWVSQEKHGSWPPAAWGVHANSCWVFGDLGVPSSSMSELCRGAGAFECSDPSVLTLT